MSSRVASIIARINAQVSLGGISVPPVPADATMPYVTVHEMTPQELENLAGSSGKIRTIIQVNVWHKDFEAGDAAQKLCKTAVRGFSGTVLGNVINAVNHHTDAYLYDGVRELHQQITRWAIWWEL